MRGSQSIDEYSVLRRDVVSCGSFEESCCLRSLGPRSLGRLAEKDDGLFRPRRQRLPSTPKRRWIIDTASYPRRLDFPQNYIVAGFVHYLQSTEQNAFLKRAVSDLRWTRCWGVASVATDRRLYVDQALSLQILSALFGWECFITKKL